MMRSPRLGYWVVLVAAVVSLLVYPRLPPRVAMHWSLAGQPNGYSPTWLAVILLPLMILAMRGLAGVLPRIDPKGANYQRFAGTYWLILNGVMLFLGLVHLAVLGYGLGAPVRMDRLIPAGVGVLLMVVGNYLTRVQPNWFVGIRTPWTLSSESVWRRTHRVGGRIMAGGGALMVLAAFLPTGVYLAVLFTTLVLVSVVPLVLSYVWWKREPKSVA
jgi:uncharacterized membrane protein